MACGMSRLSHGKYQSNLALSRSCESERLIRQNYVRSLVIGLELAFHLWVPRRQVYGPLHHLHSQPVAMDPEWATADLWRVGCSCRDHIRPGVLVLWQ